MLNAKISLLRTVITFPTLHILHGIAQIFIAGANPTIASYNASVVKTYSAVNSMARF
jgi:hypothetical protein